MRSKTKIILLVVVGLLAVSGWFGYQLVLPEAKVAKVLRGSVPKAVQANVVVQAESIMPISTEQGGRVLQRLVKRGQEVKAGELLFEIDPADLQLEIERLESEHKATKARFDLGSPVRFEIAAAETDLKNTTRLFEAGRIAQVDFDRAKRNLDVLKDKMANETINNQQLLDSQENGLKQKYRARDKMKVKAPADGTVIELNAEPGTLVSNGFILARVISKTRLIEAQISEENFMGVRPGLPVAVYFLGLYGQRHVGKVEGVVASADEKTKRYTAYLNLDIPEEQLAPGLTGEASITIAEKDNVLKIQRRALAGSKLYVVRDGRIRFTQVEIGNTNEKSAEVTLGVQEGDEYILDDLSGFRDGQRVRIVSASK